MPGRPTYRIVALVLPLSLAAAAVAQPQTARFYHWTTDDGLSQSNVLALYPDTAGFLWIGTQDGLNRFDGHTFKTYQKSDADSLSLVDDYIRTLYEDRAGRFWIGTSSGGLHRMDRKTETFDAFPAPASPSLNTENNPNNIYAIQEDTLGTLWLGTGAGLARLDPGTKRLTLYPNPDAHTVRALYLDLHNRLWVGVGYSGADIGYIIRFTPTSSSSTTDLRVDTLLIGPNVGSVNAIVGHKNGQVWAGTGKGLVQFDPDQTRPMTYTEASGLTADEIITLLVDEDDTLWIGTYQGGLIRYRIGKDQFDAFLPIAADRYSLNNNEIYALATDKHGTLWTGTYQGLNAWTTTRKAIHTTSYKPGTDHERVVALYEDETGLWTGTWGEGLLHFNRETGTLQQYKPEASDPTSLSDNVIFAMQPGTNNDFWLADFGGGLLHMDRATMRFTHYTAEANDASKLLDNYVKEILLDRHDFLWISTQFGGLHRMDTRTRQITRFYPNHLNAQHTWSLLEDHAGLIWIGTFGNGLFAYDPTSETFTSYAPQPNDSTSLSGNRVYFLFEDADRTLWIGTTEGLNRFDRATGTFSRFQEADGLANNHVTGILQDDAFGHLWISTNAGLSRFDPQTETFLTTYYVQDGIQNNRHYVGSAFKNPKGMLLFGGQKGFSIIDPRKLPPPDTTSPSIVLTRFLVRGQPYTPTDCPRCDPSRFQRIELNYDQNFFNLSFAALNFPRATPHIYRYRLEGLRNEDWTTSRHGNEAGYTSVPHGQYTLRVTTARSDGTWNASGLALTLIIHPPYWQTWWFRTLIALAVISVLAAAYVFRVRQLLRVERLRMRIASNLHDDLGADLSSIALKSQMLGMRPSLQPEERHLLGDVVRTAKETTFKLREIVWVVNTGYDTLNKLISKMEDAAGILLHGAVPYTFETPTKYPNRKLSMDFRQHVYFLFKEALQNIIKHAGATQVHIRLLLIDGTLHLHIQDDGTGFDTTAPHTGNGLPNMQRRTEAVRGTLHQESTPGKGTQLHFFAPLP